MKKLLFLFLIIILFNACSFKESIFENKKNSFNELFLLITNSSLRIDKNEAQKFSQDIINFSSFLAKKYEVNTTALIHNTLVNLKIKKRGFCYHYANDLANLLKLEEYKSFKVKKIVANEGDYFEHTALLLTRNDISFNNSIVLDAWRNTGELFFSKVIDDKRYKWKLK